MSEDTGISAGVAVQLSNVSDVTIDAFSGKLRWREGILEQEVAVRTYRGGYPIKEDLAWREVPRADQ